MVATQQPEPPIRDDREMAIRAQLRVESIPYDQLGPAGRILVDNPPSYLTPEERRRRFRVINGDNPPASAHD